MRARSFAVLALALVLAGFSVFLARSWLQANMPGTVVNEPAMQTTTVVVARVPLYFGNQLTEENLRIIDWPADSRPEGTFSTLEDIVGAEEDRRVVLRPIEAGEPILASKVSGFGGRATLSSVIADDMRAMTIRVNDVHGVAGFVLPGDRVDVLITREPDRDSPITDLLLQNVQVLGIDQDANEKRDKPQVARAVTLEVTPEQAQKLTLASTVGTLSLSLRNVLNTQAVAQRSITLKDLRIGEVNSEDKPVQQAAPAPVRVNPGIEVRVVRGLAATSQRVMPDRGPAPRQAISLTPDASVD